MCGVWCVLCVETSAGIFLLEKNKKKTKNTLYNDKMARGNVLKYILLICICLVTINGQCIISRLPKRDSLHVVNYTQRYDKRFFPER